MALSAALFMICTPSLPSPAEIESRKSDWRVGAVVYQVFVDRFAQGNTPGETPSDFRKALTKGQTFADWKSLPTPGTKDASLGCWTHELVFWGGTLGGVQSKLDYLQALQADVLYLTPIHAAFTNHRYDAQDYRQVDPKLGGGPALQRLERALDAKGMRLMLDGVFNHMGRTSPDFQAALKNPQHPKRDWFVWNSSAPEGYVGWAGAANLPEVNLDSRAVREDLWLGPESVVQSALRQGVDGWRIDVAFEFGHAYLSEITTSAKVAKPDAWVVGEISGYPSGWQGSVDGVFNWTGPAIVREATLGRASARQANAALSQLVAEAGINHLLRSWILVDNHDTPRLASTVPTWADRKLVLGAQFTLAGSPVIYYGTELGMEGAGDPANRAPMEWAKATEKKEDLSWVKTLSSLRRRLPALRVGNQLSARGDQLIAYVRATDRPDETVLVVINPSDKEISETLMIPDGRILSWNELSDVLSKLKTRCINGMASVTSPAKSIQIYTVDLSGFKQHNPYRRILPPGE